MIQLVDQAIEKFLRAEVPLPEAAVDVSFAAPDKAFGASVTKPSVNIYLWDIKRSAPRAQAGVIEATVDGQVYRRAPYPVIHLRYFLTAWAKEQRDEHQLLGSMLRALLANAELPAEHVPEEFKHLAPILLEVPSSENSKPGDFSSTLDGQRRPGMEVRVTVEVDAFGWTAAGPPTDSIDFGLNRLPEKRKPPRTPKALDEGPRPTRTRRSGSVIVEGRREPSNGNGDTSSKS